MPSNTDSSSRRQLRTRRVLACTACRSRRTRCDGKRPTCGTCEERSLNCQYPQPAGRTTLDVPGELARIRSLLDRIDRATRTNPGTQSQSSEVQVQVTSPQTPQTISLVAATSPKSFPYDFPYMKLQASTFTKMAGLGEDYGSYLLQLERSEAPDSNSPSHVFMLQHQNVMAALQSFSEKVHPWYPILERSFSRCVSTCLADSFKQGTDSFLVLMVLASGSVAQEGSHSRALQHRPDLMYLDAALKMMHLVVLEPGLRSIQCLAAASIHYYLLLRPLQAHDLAVLAIKKAQDLHLSGAFKNDPTKLEHWTRVYRSLLLIEGELVIPLKLAETNAWEQEEDIPLPTGTDIWSFDTEVASPDFASPGGVSSPQPSQVATYLLAEVAMRRMLRRNTTAISVSADGSVEYAPRVARELEEQVQHWYSFLPESLRFSQESGSPSLLENNPQITFLCAQYWAYLVSIAWPAIVKVMKSPHVAYDVLDECRAYFHSYEEFIKSATASLSTCLPNKWTIYASIFAISIGAHMGATDPALAPLTSTETWNALRTARDAFGDECSCSPSLLVMRQSIKDLLSSSAEG